MKGIPRTKMCRFSCFIIFLVGDAVYRTLGANITDSSGLRQNDHEANILDAQLLTRTF